MNKYFKNFDGDYIFSVGTGTGDAEITKEEYETILSVIKNRQKAESGFDNKLRKDMTWELVELPPVSEDEKISADEAPKIILGGEA